jgi:SRSO17 transposase
MMTTLEPDAGVLRRLDDYVGLFRGGFRRSDQARWAAVYLQGLLKGGGRKNIEALARTVPLPAGVAVEDVAQALQNFISQSPWDEDKVWQRYRALLAPRLASPDGIFVIADVTFPKQGNHSAGVQRQYSSDWGRKINCQIAVSLGYLGPAGYLPLALRLYLPRRWLDTSRRLDAAGVPPEFRRPANRGEIALELLDRVRAEGLAGGGVAAGAGYGSTPAFRAGLAERGLAYLVEVPGDLEVYPDSTAATRPMRVQTLGQRLRRRGQLAWVEVWPESEGVSQGGGDRPARLLVAERPDGDVVYALGDSSGGMAVAQAERLWQSRSRAEEEGRRLRGDFGLDHFEGRSWRGFHHHACLVMLAFGFRRWYQSAADNPD